MLMTSAGPDESLLWLLFLCLWPMSTIFRQVNAGLGTVLNTLFSSDDA